MSGLESYDQGWDAPFEMPEGPPQLEVEALTKIRVLMDSAPPFDESLMAEFLHHAKHSVAVRAAVASSLRLARQLELSLREASDMVEVARAQGGIKSLLQYHEALVLAMETIEQRPVRDEDEENQ